MMRWILRHALGPLVCAAAAASAAEIADPGAGKALYVTCAACHGPRGEGLAATKAPSLAGQTPAYLARQLESFRAGIRGADAADAEGSQMRAFATRLSDPQIRDLVAYVATLPDPETPISVHGNLENGSNYYQMKCNACHGLRAEGNPLLGAPRLAGVSDAYLLRQLERFRSGLRGSRAEDRPGRQMALMARTLPDEQTERDVIAFVRSLAPDAERKTAGPTGEAPDATSADSGFALSDRCPPHFEKLESGTCRLHTLYDAYDSLYDRGVGGLRTALPPRRDGFTPEQIDLGRYLFFDPALSGTGTLSCASCHHPDHGLSDGRARSVGAQGTEVGRSAPTLWNVAFLQRFFWDGRARSLEEQMQGPLYAAAEMGTTPEKLLQTLNGSPAYHRLFEAAFPPSESDPVTLARVYTALAAFESSLVSLGSRYDRYAHGDHEALAAPEIEGLNVFRSFVARCAECHTPPLFTNQQIAVIGVPDPEGRPFDPGAGAVFENPTWRGGFKVPTLRNIAATAPYMHAGQFAALREAAKFYTQGRGHAVPPGENLTLHWHIWEPKLTDDALDRLVDFMNALSDESAVPEIPTRVPSGLTPVTHQTSKLAFETGRY